ncbi:60S ribosomal protein L14-like [Mizuhopecten yessoensis]|uniref:Large ribosomal subunit protein eL14 n=1 Tax=Mizuhopecten yessoensis TaxID=6573 RepID=A0A210QGY3_MIZYE|nr:60S ribosomal protein L14-like [Mizuhopecten yessoensis]OWF48020.1 60S ribosomal protein L14 [Mizuhopecten yessoensis]
MVLSEFRFVEIGRVAIFAYGPDKGKLCVIVDIIDQNRALVDGPGTGVNRKQVNYKALQLTQFKLDIGRSMRTGNLLKVWNKEKVQAKWDQTTWAKKIVNKAKRKTLSDFDRFKLMKAKQARNRLITVECGKLKKQAKKAPAKPMRVRKRKS